MELVVAMTYGKALFDAAKELDKLKVIEDEVTQIDQILKKEEAYVSLLQNPAVPLAKKKQMIRNVFEGKVQQEVLSLLYILVDRGRMNYYHYIVKEYLHLYDAERGDAYGKVYSTVPLTEEQMNKIALETGALLKKKILLKNEIDSSLIGGIKVAVDGKLIDASFSSQLKNLCDRVHQF